MPDFQLVIDGERKLSPAGSIDFLITNGLTDLSQWLCPTIRSYISTLNSGNLFEGRRKDFVPYLEKLTGAPPSSHYLRIRRASIAVNYLVQNIIPFVLEGVGHRSLATELELSAPIESTNGYRTIQLLKRNRSINLLRPVIASVGYLTDLLSEPTRISYSNATTSEVAYSIEYCMYIYPAAPLRTLALRILDQLIKAE